jgi:hypothetical protein
MKTNPLAMFSSVKSTILFYNVTWRVPEEKANEFVNKRKSKKHEFAQQQQEGEHKAEHVEQRVERQEDKSSGGDTGKHTYDRGFEDIGGTDQGKFD